MRQQETMSAQADCRFCGTKLQHTLVDLGMSPLCESYVIAEKANQMEPFYPLHVYVCDNCFLAHLEQFVSAESIFSEYAYFSSYSDSWLQHAKRYTEMIVKRLDLDRSSTVLELASNDGYLLQYFVERGIRAIGIEPASNIAAVATKKGVPTVVKFFGRETARELVAQYGQADLLIGNNVLAQVPDLNDLRPADDPETGILEATGKPVESKHKVDIRTFLRSEGGRASRFQRRWPRWTWSRTARMMGMATKVSPR